MQENTLTDIPKYQGIAPHYSMYAPTHIYIYIYIYIDIPEYIYSRSEMHSTN